MKTFAPKLSRRKFVLGSGALCGGGALYTFGLESSWLDVGRHEVQLGPERSAVPIKLLHLSDLHASEVVGLDYLRRAIETGVSLKPDVICLTGDFVTSHYGQFDRYAEILSALPKCAPTVASLGNHDGGAWAAWRHRGYADTTEVRALLQHSGIELLHNALHPITLKNRTVNLAGVGDLWAGEFRAAGVLPATAGASPTILLSHNPDTKDALRNFSWDLLLCGHTHGGQLRIPLVGTPFAPVRDKRFVRGLHRWEDRWLHITNGVGNLFGARFNCRPEISLLTLV
ncbi:MAG: phosphodiesterase YaeI [Verrucomicrobia bacterium]|nr:phosphodiesterase YaeI [Verrucomicrobiota bacterium]